MIRNILILIIRLKPFTLSSGSVWLTFATRKVGLFIYLFIFYCLAAELQFQILATTDALAAIVHDNLLFSFANYC